MFSTNYEKIENETTGTVFNIEHFHVHDGEGLRVNVFLKGCTLHCPWCCNPESITPGVQIAQYKNLCTGCGRCIEACPNGCCQRNTDGTVVTDYDKCTVCGACVSACLSSAREQMGNTMSVSDVIHEVEKDAFYFLNSDGGLTLSGGEACMQPTFAAEIARAAHRRYIPVALDTAAVVSWDNLWTVAKEVDEILIDVKTLSVEQSSQVGSQYYEKFLNNLHKLSLSDKLIIVRCPIIPGFNDNYLHMDRIVAITKEFGLKRVDLLPFHQLGRHKYEAIGRDYLMKDYPEMDRVKVEEFAQYLREKGLDVTVGG